MHLNHKRGFDFDDDLYMLILFLAWNEGSWRQICKMIWHLCNNRDRKVLKKSNFTPALRAVEWVLSDTKPPDLLPLPHNATCLHAHWPFYLPNVNSTPRNAEEKCEVWEANVLKLIVQPVSPCWKELSKKYLRTYILHDQIMRLCFEKNRRAWIMSIILNIIKVDRDVWKKLSAEILFDSFL